MAEVGARARRDLLFRPFRLSGRLGAAGRGFGSRAYQDFPEVPLVAQLALCPETLSLGAERHKRQLVGMLQPRYVPNVLSRLQTLG